MLPQANAQPLYPPELSQPMEEELTRIGVVALKAAQDVDAALSQNQNAIIIVNSVCGCAAGCARPGIAIALKQLPSSLSIKWFTVFAGVDREATNQARTHTPGIGPSSPSIFFFKNGKLVDSLSRHQIEGRMPEQVASELVQKATQSFS